MLNLITCEKTKQMTQWGSTSDSTASRLRFPRKAAFFTLVAAEAMARCNCVNALERASQLYLAASHLYSRNGNAFENGNNSATRYGWATLRVASLQGLASQSIDMEAAEAGEHFFVVKRICSLLNLLNTACFAPLLSKQRNS